jgi:hypothetical protein
MNFLYLNTKMDHDTHSPFFAPAFIFFPYKHWTLLFLLVRTFNLPINTSIIHARPRIIRAFADLIWSSDFFELAPSLFWIADVDFFFWKILPALISSETTLFLKDPHSCKLRQENPDPDFELQWIEFLTGLFPCSKWSTQSGWMTDFEVRKNIFSLDKRYGIVYPKVKPISQYSVWKFRVMKVHG